MEEISVTGFATGAPPGTRDIVVMAAGIHGRRDTWTWIERRPQSVRARRHNQGFARSSNRVVGSLATPTGSNFERLIENFDFQPPGDRRAVTAVFD